MGGYKGPKNRIARKFGVNIFSRAKNPLLRKPNPPGMHGGKRKKKSDYGIQLEEKQKLKACYGMLSEHQLLRYYKEASSRHQNTVELLLQMLESRLDVVVFRLNFASTIFGAQQLIAHGHIQVNGRKVDIKSFRVKPGMVVSVREKSKENKNIRAALENTARSVPAYMEQDAQKSEGRILSLPSIDAISLPIEVNTAMVCDFLSHKG